MEQSDLDRDSLKIGDYVVLRDTKFGNILTAEGILNNEVYGADQVLSIHESLFCIHLQRQYSASRELTAFLENYKNSTDESELKYLQALERGRDNENILNDTYMKNKLGQVVLFGDIIQLYHVASGKYLQVIPSKLAKSERENVYIDMDLNGNSFSWLQINPRFKIDKEGDRILNGTEIYLKVAERANEFVHLADKVNISGMREVNCSLELTSWKVGIFQKCTDTFDRNYLLYSELIYISDPETKSYLKINFDKDSDYYSANVNKNKLQVTYEEYRDEDDDDDDDYDDEEEEDETHEHEYGDVFLAPCNDNTNLSSNFLWLLESRSFFTGGLIKWRTDQVRIRHLNSGLYLKQETKLLNDDLNRSRLINMFTKTYDRNAPGTLFNIVELNSLSKYLTNQKALQIGYNGVWFDRGEVIEGNQVSFMVLGTKLQESAVSLMISRYSCYNRSNLTDTAENKENDGSNNSNNIIFNQSSTSLNLNSNMSTPISSNNKSNNSNIYDIFDPSIRMYSPLDIFIGSAAHLFFRKYLEVTEYIKDSNDVHTILNHINHFDIASFSNITNQIIRFLQGYPYLLFTSNNKSDKYEESLRIPRKNLMREQGTLEIILKLVNNLVPILKKLNSKTNKRIKNDKSWILKVSHLLQSASFMVLYNSILDNPTNQMYVADYMPAFLANLSSQPIAVKCVTEMLSKNLELQETKIGSREIQVFVDSLRSSKLNTMYLELLQACCSCQGVGVDTNQCKVANMLFSDTTDILLTIQADISQFFPCSWDLSGNLYIKDNELIRGADLISKGIPRLSLVWLKPKDPQLKYVGLLEDLFDPSAISLSAKHNLDYLEFEDSVKSQMTKNTLTSKSNESNKQRKMIIDYFIAQMHLAAEMSMDRNYIAMHKIDSLFPYDFLVSILKLQVSNSLKAASVRLISCLYIDRDPQTASRIPLLTRVWSDVKNFPDPQLPFVDTSKRFYFGLLQEIIRDQLTSMSNSRWDSLSLYILKLLRLLVKFKYYGSVDRIHNILTPLVAALDRRQVKDDSKTFATLSIVKTSDQNKVDKSRSNKSNSAKFNKILQLRGDEMDNNSGKSHDIEDLNLDFENNNNRFLFIFKYFKFIHKFSLNQLAISTLDFLNSFYFSIFVSFLAIFQSIVLILHIVVSNIFSDSNIIDTIVKIIFIFFLFELLFRILSNIQLKVTLNKFFQESRNSVDFIVILFSSLLYFLLPAGYRAYSLIVIFRANYLYYYLTNRKIILTILKAKKLNSNINEDEFSSSNANTNSKASVNLLNEIKNSINNPRYTNLSKLELETMVEAVDILAYLQKLIEDRNISILLRKFFTWERGYVKADPVVLFNQAIETASHLTLNVSNFEDVMLDCLMFNHPPLVQSVLEVLMSFYSLRNNLMENINNVQLLAVHKREKQFKSIEQMLQQLEQNAETHELWGSLTTNSDKATNKQTITILEDLISMCRSLPTTLEYNQEYVPEADIQELFRNLGFFEISKKVLGLLDSINKNENRKSESSSNKLNSGIFSSTGNNKLISQNILDETSLAELEITENTKNLCKLCNTVIYWFLYNNPKNQNIGFQNLDFFINTLDDGINSHKVISAIFYNNEYLMRRLPHTYLIQLADKIVKNGQNHQYLTLFSSITHVGYKNIVENQLEIVKLLTSPGRLQKIACFFVPVNHPDYKKKKEIMKSINKKGALRTTSDLNLLPNALSYHLSLLEVFSSCTVGRMNITTVEAKVQSVFHFIDVINSILDKDTITICKIYLSKFLYNSVIEVELKIPSLEQSPYIWKLLESYIVLLSVSKGEFILLEHEGFDSPNVNRLNLEYVLTSIMIINGFFTRYYDPTTFRFYDGTNATTADKVQLTQNQANDLIESLYYKLKAIYDLNLKIFSNNTKKIIYLTLEILLKSTTDEIDSMNFFDIDDNSHQHSHNKINPEAKITEKFHLFTSIISTSKTISTQILNESVSFIRILERLPRLNDNISADVKFEPLIYKLVSHIKDSIVSNETRKYMDIRYIKTSTWILTAFRTMIENRMGMTIYDRDEHGGELQDIAVAPVVSVLNNCGATILCLDLIADGIDDNLQIEAIKLIIALLYKEGGAIDVQRVIFNHLNLSNSELFFKQIRTIIHRLLFWHTWNQNLQIPPDESPPLPDDILIIRLIQLMCEGHYLPNQELLREQSNNRTSYNILDDLVLYLNNLSRIPSRVSSHAMLRVLSGILEVMQGPCEKNQLHFALNTELIETLNRINRSKLMKSFTLPYEEIEVKKAAIDSFQGLLEGQGEKSLVYERVLSVIHIDIIQMMSKGISILDPLSNEEIELYLNQFKNNFNREQNILNNNKYLVISSNDEFYEYNNEENSQNENFFSKLIYLFNYYKNYKKNKLNNKKSYNKNYNKVQFKKNKENFFEIDMYDKELLLILQTECIVLLQMLCNFKPSLYEELGISKNIEDYLLSGPATGNFNSNSTNSTIPKNKSKIFSFSTLFMIIYNIFEIFFKSMYSVLLIILSVFTNSNKKTLSSISSTANTSTNPNSPISHTAMIEVVWRGELHRRFFHVPKICSYLAKSSRESLLITIDRSNPENKLVDFISRANDLYQEVKHQELLMKLNLNNIFSRKNKNKATWITFYISLIINFLFLFFYKTKIDSNNEEVLEISSEIVKQIIFSLNIIQISVAFFILVLNLIIRSPIIYVSLKKQNFTFFEILIFILFDYETIYYFIYLIISLSGLIFYELFLPFLLLDIVVKNTTTRDVLNSVLLPRKQLAMTLLLGIFITYIYSYFIFLNFRDNIGGIYGQGIVPGSNDCESLLGCFMFVFCYGLRQGGGIGDVMNLSVGVQWLLDLTYFLVVIVMLLNIIFGVIIDTFGELRAEKSRRELDTSGVCFICGIDRQVFDRFLSDINSSEINKNLNSMASNNQSSSLEGFNCHIKYDHNMWNYLYYIFMLWEQDRDEDDGLEYYIRNCIESNDISWFPLHKSMRLMHSISSSSSSSAVKASYEINSLSGGSNLFNDKDLMKKLSEKLDNKNVDNTSDSTSTHLNEKEETFVTIFNSLNRLNSKINSNINSFSDDISITLTHLMNSTKQNFVPGEAKNQIKKFLINATSNNQINSNQGNNLIHSNSTNSEDLVMFFNDLDNYSYTDDIIEEGEDEDEDEDEDNNLEINTM